MAVRDLPIGTLEGILTDRGYTDVMPRVDTRYLKKVPQRERPIAKRARVRRLYDADCPSKLSDSELMEVIQEMYAARKFARLYPNEFRYRSFLDEHGWAEDVHHYRAVQP